MSEYDEIRQRFERETAKHELTVLHDDGLYRHLRFMQPKSGSSCYWFDVITVPGALIFRGDGESFVFSRLEDMFAFFRQSSWDDGINPQYWSEKLTSDRDSCMKYSQELFNQHVADDLKAAEENYPGVTADWTEKTERFLAEYDTTYLEAARQALDDFEYLPDDATGEPFRFQDTWEWKLKDYGWWFLWACHAIVWGIAQYDAARKQVAA